MGKRIKYQKLKNYLYYNIKELANVLDVSISAVKYWAHHGLEPINRDDWKWYFSGKDVKEYLKTKNNQFKVKLNEHEIYCLSCRIGVTANPTTLKLIKSNRRLGKQINNYLIMIEAKCGKCHHQCYRISSSNSIESFLAHYELSRGDLMDKSSDQRKE